MKILNVKTPPIRLHFSLVFLFLAYITYIGTSYGLNASLTAGVLCAILFLSVLFHELGHSFKAQELGYKTHHITLYPFGGIAAIGPSKKTGKSMMSSPADEFKIALAGPVVNIKIFIVSSIIYFLTHAPFVLEIAVLNFAMGVFNLIPAYPMDGGRLLKSKLSTKIGSKASTRMCLKISAFLALCFIGAGIFYNLIMLSAVGAILLLTIRQEFTKLNNDFMSGPVTKYFNFC